MDTEYVPKLRVKIKFQLPPFQTYIYITDMHSLQLGRADYTLGFATHFLVLNFYRRISSHTAATFVCVVVLFRKHLHGSTYTRIIPYVNSYKTGRRSSSRKQAANHFTGWKHDRERVGTLVTWTARPPTSVETACEVQVDHSFVRR